LLFDSGILKMQRTSFILIIEYGTIQLYASRPKIIGTAHWSIT
jgi:hypothetical protein